MCGNTFAFAQSHIRCRPKRTSLWHFWYLHCSRWRYDKIKKKERRKSTKYIDKQTTKRIKWSGCCQRYEKYSTQASATASLLRLWIHNKRRNFLFHFSHRAHTHSIAVISFCFCFLSIVSRVAILWLEKWVFRQRAPSLAVRIRTTPFVFSVDRRRRLRHSSAMSILQSSLQLCVCHCWQCLYSAYTRHDTPHRVSLSIHILFEYR